MADVIPTCLRVCAYEANVMLVFNEGPEGTNQYLQLAPEAARHIARSILEAADFIEAPRS